MVRFLIKVVVCLKILISCPMLIIFAQDIDSGLLLNVFGLVQCLFVCKLYLNVCR